MDRYPAPFLGPLFPSNVEPAIITGYEYHSEEIALHGVDGHGAIDLRVPRGTQVLSPCDGYAVATYFEWMLTDSRGQARKLSVYQVLKRNPLNYDIVPPGSHKTKQYAMYFGGYFVQIWNPATGWYVQLGHLDYAQGMPYYKPHIDKDGDLSAPPILRAPTEQYKDPAQAAWVRAGDVVGFVGMTGCGWGTRNYDFAHFDADGRPDFRGVEYPRAYEPHLHLVVCGPRDPITRDAEWICPFGIYGDRYAGYPQSRATWHIRQPNAQHDPLWLPQG